MKLPNRFLWLVALLALALAAVLGYGALAPLLGWAKIGVETLMVLIGVGVLFTGAAAILRANPMSLLNPQNFLPIAAGAAVLLFLGLSILMLIGGGS